MFDEKWEAEDLGCNIPDDIRNMNLLLAAKNSIMPFLRFKGETTSEFPDGRLPTLDCAIFVSDGKFLHSFYEKTMRSENCLV